MVYNKYFAKPVQSGILKSYRALTKISNFILKNRIPSYFYYKQIHNIQQKYILVLQNAIFLMEEETVLHVSDSLKGPTIEIIDECYYMCNENLFY